MKICMSDGGSSFEGMMYGVGCTAFSINRVSRASEIPLQTQNGVFVVPVLINGALTLNFMVDSGATAVITYDHHIATMLVGAAPTLNLVIPHDFSLICFNDVFPVALLPPPLTAVAVSGREMGRMGADLLLNSLVSSKPHATW
jgi:hypothetical protein